MLSSGYGFRPFPFFTLELCTRIDLWLEIQRAALVLLNSSRLVIRAQILRAIGRFPPSPRSETHSASTRNACFQD